MCLRHVFALGIDRLVKKLYFDNDIDKAAKCVYLVDLLKPQIP